MNYFSLPIIILSAISIYLAVYYLILFIKNGLQKQHLVVSAICFFYFVYDCARIGIYNSQAKFWNYLWLTSALTAIPIIAIFIIILLAYILNERISRHYDYLIIIIVYAMFAAALVFEAVMLFPESFSFTLVSKINGNPVHFTVHRGSMDIMMLAFVFVSIMYFFIKLYFYFKNNEMKKKRIILIIVCLTGLFFFVIHDLLITLGAIPLYLFLGEYGIFFIIIMVTSFSLNPDIFSALTSANINRPGTNLENAGYTHSLLTDIDIKRIHEKLNEAMAMDKMYAEPDITLRSLAKKLSISYHVLSQFLNSVIGMEFRNFINQLRIEEAKRIIASEPESSIISVCYNVGFQSKSAFNNAFKKFVGISPTEFKKIESGRGSKTF